MRTAAIIAFASAMVSTVLAAPAPVAVADAAPAPGGDWKHKGSWGWGRPWQGNKGKNKDKCLTDEDAQEVASVFQQLIQGYTLELTEEALTVDFVDWSSAVNIIRNRGGEGPNVVNAVTFTSREQFSANHGKQPNIPFETLNVFHGCNHTSVRWQTLRSGNGQPKEQAAIVSHLQYNDVFRHRLTFPSSPSLVPPSSRPFPTPRTASAGASRPSSLSSTLPPGS